MSGRNNEPTYRMSYGLSDLPIRSYGASDNAYRSAELYRSGSERHTGDDRSAAYPEYDGPYSPGPFRHADMREDETVLACYQHAGGVARAHGAREVMLEHLVHAMARVPEAVSVLEEQGVHVGELRRESAQVISSEIPVCRTNGDSNLRGSNDFTTVMFLAAASASRRGERATSIRDVLDVLLNYNPRAQAVQLLRRHAPHMDRPEPVDQFRDLRGTIERQSAELRDLRSMFGRIMSAPAPDNSAQHHALLQRMEAFERNLSGQVRSGGSDPALAEQLRNIHGLVSRRLEEASTTAGDLDRRLDRLEEIFGGSGAEFASTRSALIERLDRLEKLLDTDGDGDAESERIAFLDRLARIEELLSEKDNESLTAQMMLEERLDRIEQSVSSGAGGNQEALVKAIAAQFHTLEQRVSAVPAVDPEVINRAIDQRFDRLERTLLAQTGNADAVSSLIDDRIGRLEAYLSQHSGSDNSGLMSQLDERLGLFEDSGRDRDTAIARSWGSTNDRIALLETSIAAQRRESAGRSQEVSSDLEEIRRSLNKLIHAQQAQADALVEMRQATSADLGVVSNRLSSMEQGSGGEHRLRNGNGHDDGELHYTRSVRSEETSSERAEAAAYRYDAPPVGESRVAGDAPGGAKARDLAQKTFKALSGKKLTSSIKEMASEASVSIRNARDTSAARLKQATSGLQGRRTVEDAEQARVREEAKVRIDREKREKLASALDPLLQRPLTTLIIGCIALGLVSATALGAGHSDPGVTLLALETTILRA